MLLPWLEREALTVVKAYPNPSAKYAETVCVAAITREEGLVRLYPVNFRALPEDQRFQKYQLVRLRMMKHEKDGRPESYRPDQDSLTLGQVVDSGQRWRQRRQWLRPILGPTMCDLQRLQAETNRSLGCIRPADVSELEVEDAPADWSGKKKSAMDQLPLFDPITTKLEKVPFVFRYVYRCESPSCNGHRQSILDWEAMELYRKLRDGGCPRDEIVGQIRTKFLNELCGAAKDTHFFVGNHSQYPNAFMVLGVFWPPKGQQPEFAFADA